jgi:hypothetical protein
VRGRQDVPLGLRHGRAEKRGEADTTAIDKLAKVAQLREKP